MDTEIPVIICGTDFSSAAVEGIAAAITRKVERQTLADAGGRVSGSRPL
jgi:hypothetical protein